MKGDLLKLVMKGDFDVIVHGCNCFHTMGSGIAKQIKAKFPNAYHADITTTTKGDKSKLGGYSWVEYDNIHGNKFTIINGYTQFTYGQGIHVNYDAVRGVFHRIAEDFHTSRIGYPKIGAGLAGGDWPKIQTIINEELVSMHHTLVTFN